MVKYKSETYRGETITFQKLSKGYIGAKAPNRTKQYLGMGKTKKEAFDDLKNSADKINRAGNWHRKLNKAPKGYHKVAGASTAPIGYDWWANDASRFVKNSKRKSVLVKEKR